MSDLTVVYYSANVVPEEFGAKIRNQIKKATDAPIISVTKKATDFGHNIVVSTPRSHISIYRDALVGVKAAKTKYVALCEDDVLYSPEHFKRRPTDGVFAYNMSSWNIHPWESIFHHKAGGRRNLNSLICERDLFIQAMEERFAKHPEGTDAAVWAEPGKYEKNIGVTIRPTEVFYSNPPNIIFYHETALSYEHLAKRKRVGEFRAIEIPYWGRAEEIIKEYK